MCTVKVVASNLTLLGRKKERGEEEEDSCRNEMYSK